ncbi:MAG: HugZ family protein [Gammaproteobacteria bacterium]|nr:HugZ family protein [Gammaproteobacteria bacterium]
MSGETGPDALLSEAHAFIAPFKSLTLATVSAAGEPLASQAPCVFGLGSGSAFVFVSALAAHTGNMLASARASVLFAAPDEATAQPFARVRLTAFCTVRPIPRDDGDWDSVLRVFSQRFGPIMDTLRELQDFHLLALTPISAQYVKGFADAHTIAAAHIGELFG